MKNVSVRRGRSRRLARNVRLALKDEADRTRICAGGDEVSPAKGGQEVVERDFVRHIGDREAQSHVRIILLPEEQIVRADPDIEQVARRYARWIVISIGGALRRYL